MADPIHVFSKRVIYFHPLDTVLSFTLNEHLWSLVALNWSAQSILFRHRPLKWIHSPCILVLSWSPPQHSAVHD